MGPIIYAMCALTSLSCTVLLYRSYRLNKYRLLFWSALCFAGLFLNNVVLILDRVVFPVEVDLSTWRLGISLLALLPLLYGLIWEED
jgi:hypothetical protein